MFFGRSGEALKMAQSALDAARESRSTIDGHMKECTLRHEQVQKTLDGQNLVLGKIQGFLTRGTFGVIGLLLTVLGAMVLQFVSHVKWMP